MTGTPTFAAAGGDPGHGLEGEALWQAAASLFALRDSGLVVQRLVEVGRTLAGADASLVLVYDLETGEFRPHVPSVALGLDQRWLRREGLEAAQVLAQQAAAARDLVALPQTAATPASELPYLAGGQRPAAACALPLVAEGAVIGVLELYGGSPGVFWEVETLRGFAALAAAALVNARAHEQGQVARAQLEALDTASRTLTSELALDQVLQRIVEIAAQISGARYGALGVVGPDGYLSDFITTGLSPAERERIGPLPHGHGLLGLLIRVGRPVRVANINRDPRRIGFPPHHPPMTSLLGVPVRVRGEVVGDLYLTDKEGAPEFSEDDQRLIELLAAHAGIAIENARLYAQLRDLSTLSERARIGRDLHDGIIPDLYATTLQLENVASDLEGSAQDRLLGLAETISGVIGDVRAYIEGLRSQRFRGRALEEALAALVAEMAEGSGPPVTLTLTGSTVTLPDELVTALLQIAREALANVARHAQATRAEVHLASEPAEVRLRVQDDGEGFDLGVAQDEGHRGLRNLHSRVEEAGGQLTVESAPGGGTIITARVPLDPAR
ncbi:MAG: hypothetical protein NVSMB65_05690 [Chloroflexota bacterium]